MFCKKWTNILNSLALKVTWTPLSTALLKMKKTMGNSYVSLNKKKNSPLPPTRPNFCFESLQFSDWKTKKKSSRKAGGEAPGKEGPKVPFVSSPKDLSNDEKWRHYYYARKFHFGVRDSRDVVHQYLLGLNWVQRYYHLGVPSWSWFYPYHYAPLASDMTKLPELPIEFEKSKPYLPFQQLLGVLPPASSRFLPKAYARLMTTPDSPIADFYPEDFEIDMEGKRNAWEGVVKIDFVNEKRLVAASESIDPQTELNAEERARNTLGVTYLYKYDATEVGRLESAFPEYFGPLEPLLSKQLVVELPPLPPNFRFAVPAGTGLGPEAPPGFPSLYWRAFDTELSKTPPVNVFGRPSHQPSQTLIVLDSEIELDDASALVGQRAWAQWPHLIEVEVLEVLHVLRSGPGERYSLDPTSNAVRIDRLSPHQCAAVRSEAREAAHEAWRVAKAVELPSGAPETQTVVRCAPFVGMRNMPDGSQKKVFGGGLDLRVSLLFFFLFLVLWKFLCFVC